MFFATIVVTGHGSSGRAPALGAGGSRFKSGCPDFFMNHSTSAHIGVFNRFHTPDETAEQSSHGGIQTVTSVVFHTPFTFDKLVLSANVRSQTDGCLLLEAQVCVDGQWSEFYKLGLLSGKFKTSFPPQQDAFGQVQTDQLELVHPAQAYRYRLKLYGDMELLLLAASCVQGPFVYNEKSASRVPPGEYTHPIIPLSQMEQDTPQKRRICSPTCLCMALQALDYAAPLGEVLSRAFDQTAGLYGNWVFNVAAAASFGAQVFFRRFAQLEELEHFVHADSLVIASLAFGRGELPNAPLEKTPGHLVLVRGWKKQTVLVADPAAPTASSVLREYNATDFARAWLCNKQGAAYVVRHP